MNGSVLAYLLVASLCYLGRCGEEGALTKTCPSHTRRLLVSTVDGGLTALDLAGNTLWSHTLSSPLFKSTLNAAGGPQLIPGLDKHLYQWNGEKLERLPVTAEDLLREKFPFGQHSNLVGAKVKEITGVSIYTGAKLYECTPWECRSYGNKSKISNVDVLIVERQSVTVREVEEVRGEELWNFTIGDVSLSLVEGVDDEEVSCVTNDLGWSVRLDAATGLLVALDSVTEDRLWEKKLSAPVVSVWMQDGGQLSRITPRTLALPVLGMQTAPALMLIGHDNQQYVQPLPRIAGPGSLSLDAHFSSLMVQKFSAAVVEEERGLIPFSLGALNSFTGPEAGQAVYFFRDPETGEADYLPEQDREEVAASDEAGEGETGWSLQRVFFSVLKYSLFAVFVVVLERTHRHLRRRSEPSESSPEEEECVVVGGARLPELVEECTEDSASGESAPRLEKRHSSVDSRFGSDYELRGCLGKGGFGVVYHVQNKTDGREYALKRIKLPSQKPAREKVMREVHALAQLEHPKIVRYFHSWVEQAPDGWTDQEEWTPLSRQASLVFTEQSSVNSVQPSSQSLVSHSGFSPSPSFNSLNHSTIHSEIPPPFSVESRSSSFVVEFREEEEGEGEGEGEGERGCFRRDQLFSSADFSGSDSSGFASTPDCSRGPPQEQVAVAPPTYLFIQMQLCRKDSLKDWLRNVVQNRSFSLARLYFEQVLDAVLYVHREGMIHRDLKPSNIFFSLEGSIKVGDFGLVASNRAPPLSSPQLLAKYCGEDSRHTGNIGSHLYMSPEQMAGRRYDQKVDIFSLGVIFFELHHPFATEMERVKVLEDLRQQKLPTRFRTALPREARLVEWMTSAVASQRPSAAELVDASGAFKRTANHANAVLPKI